MLRRHHSRSGKFACAVTLPSLYPKDAIEFVPTSRRRDACGETFCRLVYIANHATRKHETLMPLETRSNAICFDYKNFAKEKNANKLFSCFVFRVITGVGISRWPRVLVTRPWNVMLAQYTQFDIHDRKKKKCLLRHFLQNSLTSRTSFLANAKAISRSQMCGHVIPMRVTDLHVSRGCAVSRLIGVNSDNSYSCCNNFVRPFHRHSPCIRHSVVIRAHNNQARIRIGLPCRL